MIRPCDRCRRKFKEELLVRKWGKMLCRPCVHEWRKHYDEKLDRGGIPEILRQTTSAEGEVVIAGKDVPYGYQDDPKVISQKMEQEELLRYKRLQAGEKQNKAYWERYRLDEDFRKMVDEKWLRLYREVGAKMLRAQGVPESAIQKMMKEVLQNGKRKKS